VPTRTVLEWNGRDLPEQLRELPAGRYVHLPFDELVELSPEEEAGLLSALERARAGVTSHADVMVRAAEVLDG
jgi:broad specificity phosphatase PhoE